MNDPYFGLFAIFDGILIYFFNNLNAFHEDSSENDSRTDDILALEQTLCGKLILFYLSKAGSDKC